jgi:hypothetical protein
MNKRQLKLRQRKTQLIKKSARIKRQLNQIEIKQRFLKLVEKECHYCINEIPIEDVKIIRKLKVQYSRKSL